MKMIRNMILLIMLICIIQIDNAFAQKQVPTPQSLSRPDSTAAQEQQPEQSSPLPSLDLKEYTILGKEKIQVLPFQRTDIELQDVTARERLAEIENREAYNPPRAGGNKSKGLFDTPVAGVVNEVYGSFGKYTDINAGLKMRRQFRDEEFFGDIDFRKSNGHVNNAEYSDWTGSIANIHNFSENLQNRTEVKLNAHEYSFYGSPVLPEREKKGYVLDGASLLQISIFDPVDVRLEIGGRYNNPDETKLFNWDAWSRLNFDAVVLHSTLISGLVEFSTDRIKDGAHDNAPLNELNYSKAQLTVVRLLSPRLHVRVGGTYFNYRSESADPAFEILDDNTIIFTERILAERKDNKFYPLASLTYDLEEAGRFFVEFEPSVATTSLVDKLNFNPYFDISTPLSHEVTTQNFRVGWHRSYAYDLAFELIYNDRRLENYGFLVENGLGLSLQPDGQWTYLYDNKIDINEYSGLVNWNPNPRFNALLSARLMDITIVESQFPDNVPYLPELVFDYSMQYTPGYGFQFIVDGQYVGKRYAHPINYDNTKLDGYFIANVTVSKRWSKLLGSYLYFANLFNEDYEIWRDYQAPDFNGGAGLRLFW